MAEAWMKFPPPMSAFVKSAPSTVQSSNTGSSPTALVKIARVRLAFSPPRIPAIVVFAKLVCWADVPSNWASVRLARRKSGPVEVRRGEPGAFAIGRVKVGVGQDRFGEVGISGDRLLEHGLRHPGVLESRTGQIHLGQVGAVISAPTSDASASTARRSDRNRRVSPHRGCSRSDWPRPARRVANVALANTACSAWTSRRSAPSRFASVRSLPVRFAAVSTRGLERRSA